MNNLKDDAWLHTQIDAGTDLDEIAAACNSTSDAVADRLIKIGQRNGIVAIGDRDCHDILVECGQRRLHIPYKVLEAARPTAYSRIAVFGGGGFVGTNLVRRLRAKDYCVLNVSRRDCDALNRRDVDRYLADQRPCVAINLAAFVGGIGLNRDNPADMIYKNLMMSANIVDSCFTNGVRKLIMLGSVCSYPHTPPRIPFIEDDLWLNRPEPTNEPYGVAKKTIGLMLDAYKRQFNFCSAYLIPTNMYGPDDDFSSHGSHVIPAMIKKFVAAVDGAAPSVAHWGDGTATRDFLFVDDCCAAIEAAIDRIDDPVPINLGFGREYSMKELSSTLAEIIGFKGRVDWQTAQPNGQPRRCLNIDRARTMLDFRPKTDLRAGLQATVDWYRSQQCHLHG